MRTKIGKRIGPVPIALVAVLALAAFISAGLWLVPGGNQTAEAQGRGDTPASKCVVTDNTILNPTDAEPPVTDSNRPLVYVPENCFVTGNAVTVEFTNPDPAEATFHVFTDGRITDGSNRKVYVNGTVPEPTEAPETAITSYYLLKVPARAIGETDPGRATITVTRNGKSQISLDAYATLPTPGVSAAVLPAPTADGDVNDTIVFSPALDAPDADASSVSVNAGAEVPEDKDEAKVFTIFDDAATAVFDMEWGSAGENTISIQGTDFVYDALVGDLASFLVPGAEITISNEDESYKHTIAIDDDSRMMGTTVGTAPDTSDEPADNADITVTASLSRNVEGTVTVTVGGGDDVMLEAGLSTGKSLTMTAKQARSSGTGLKVVGLPETGNIRVEVSAEFNGDTGSLTKKGYAMRTNEVVDSVVAKTYACKQQDVAAERMPDPDNSGEMIADRSMICAVEGMATTKVSDLTETATFPPGSMFLIIATVTDSAGNPLEGERITARQSAGPTRLGITAGTANTDSKGMARLIATAKPEEDADGGTYTLAVSRGSVSDSIDVNLAGDVANLGFPEGRQSDPISASDSLGTFIVKATDVNGNLPINVGDGPTDFEALVSVRPSTSVVLNTADGKIKFDAKTGEATFYVQVSDDAEIGDSLTVTVTAIDNDDIAPASITVTYGGEMMVPGIPMNVMAEATSHDHDCRVLGVPRRQRRQRHHRLRAAAQDWHDGLYDHCGQQRRGLVEHPGLPDDER